MFTRFFLYLLVLLYILSSNEEKFSGNTFYLYILSNTRILLFLIGEAIFVPFLLGIGVYAIKRNKRLTELVGSE